MNLELRDLLRVHACAFNGRDLETLAGQAAPHAACFCDGKWVGEGPEGVRRLLEAEYARDEGMIARVEEQRGEPVIVEFTKDGRERRGTVQFLGERGDGRIHEVRIEHHGPVMRVGMPEPGR